MPYAEPTTQREFQRQWVADRRAQYLEGKSCWACGTTENLRVVFPGGPLPRGGHTIWTWADSRREEALKQATVLCQRHSAQLAALRAGRHVDDVLGLRNLLEAHSPPAIPRTGPRARPRNAKLTAQDVVDIRRRKGKQSTEELAEEYGVHRGTIWQVTKGKKTMPQPRKPKTQTPQTEDRVMQVFNAMRNRKRIRVKTETRDFTGHVWEIGLSPYGAETVARVADREGDVHYFRIERAQVETL